MDEISWKMKKTKLANKYVFLGHRMIGKCAIALQVAHLFQLSFVILQHILLVQ